MGKVVIERPRSGSSARSLKVRHVGRFISSEEGLDYDGPIRVPRSDGRGRGYRPRLGEKNFTDVLGPIRRYLHSRVGKPWNKTWSEIQKTLGSGSHPIQHVVDHVLEHVATDVFIEDRRLWQISRYWGKHSVEGFYVCPKTGLLKFIPEMPRRSMAKKEPIDPKAEYFARINGIWFLGRYEKKMGDSATREDEFEFRKIRQLSTKEIKHFGLKQQTVAC